MTKMGPDQHPNIDPEDGITGKQKKRAKIEVPIEKNTSLRGISSRGGFSERSTGDAADAFFLEILCSAIARVGQKTGLGEIRPPANRH